MYICLNKIDRDKSRCSQSMFLRIFYGIGNSFGILFHKIHTSCEDAQLAERSLLLRNRSRA